MIEVFKRADGKWAWRLQAANGDIIATDGGQGYENRADAVRMAERIIVKGGFANVPFRVDGQEF